MPQRRSIFQSLNRRTVQVGSHASVFTLIVLVVAVLLYLMAINHNHRLDVTRSKRFTLASQSVNVLRRLSQPVKIVGFFQLEGSERQPFEDLLRQYTHHTDNVTYELIDPDRQPALAKRYNITAYNTIVVAAREKEEKLFRVDEEALTNAIMKVTRDTTKIVYFIAGHGEPAITDSERSGYSLAKQELEAQTYQVKELILARQPQIPDDAAVVIVAGLQKDLLEPEQQALRAYLERGGHLLFMLDPGMAPGLVPFLQAYGIELGNDVVIETNALGRLFGGDYHMPAVTTYERHPITRDLGGMMTIFPMVRSVRVAETLPEGMRVQSLASTSPQSWAEMDLNALEEGRSTFDGDRDLKGPLSIAVVATIPPRQAATPEPATTMATPPGKRPAARLVVFGDSEFATNHFFALQGNGDLFLNTVSWLAEEEDLIAIRPRQDGRSGPVMLTEAQQPLLFWLPVVLLPLSVLLAGGVVLIKRRWQQ